MKTLAIIVSLMVFAPAAIAGSPCGVRVVQQKAFVAQHVVAAPVYYFVGQQTHAAAQLEKEKQTDADYQEFLRFRQFSQDIDLYQRFLEFQGIAAGQSKRSVMIEKCGKCHMGGSTKGGFAIGPDLDAATKEAIATVVWSETMPPGEPLTDEESAAIYDELFKKGK